MAAELVGNGPAEAAGLSVSLEPKINPLKMGRRSPLTSERLDRMKRGSRRPFVLKRLEGCRREEAARMEDDFSAPADSEAGKSGSGPQNFLIGKAKKNDVSSASGSRVVRGACALADDPPALPSRSGPAAGDGLNGMTFCRQSSAQARAQASSSDDDDVSHFLESGQPREA